MTRHIVDSRTRQSETGSRLRHYLSFERRMRPGDATKAAQRAERTGSQKKRLLAFVRIAHRRENLT